MWKAACWALSNNDLYDVKERAMYGALCGNLKAMLEVGGSWEDYVWSYYKTMVDVATEKRIQQSANIRRPWQHIHSMLLPDEYFLQKSELDDVRTVFEKIGHSPDKSIAEEAKNPNHFIQRCIILNDMDGLLDEILLWIDEESIHPQLLRFAAHLLLILQSFGMTLNYEKCAQILEAYVKQLISDGRAGHLVAAYTACLPSDRQLDCYATFLETIEDGDLRKEYLELASEAGLDVTAITKNVVERIRAQGVPDTAPLQVSQGDDLTLEPPLTPGDHKKIDAIEWLVFDPAQRSEALKQSNAVIRGFLAARKFSAARQVFQKIPRDSVEIIHREWHAVADKDVPLPAGTDNAIREHICVQAYLSAQSTFSDWFKHFHNKPHEYEPANQASTFASVSLSDLVAEEHRQKKQEEELGRWREVLEGLCFAALDKIYNVLLFPEGGWLVDVREDTEDNEENRCRHHQMSLLRRLYVPSLCDLLLNVLLNTGGRNDQCSKLADVIADEDNKLYELFTKQEGKRILERIQDAMVDIL
ncbi:unnamed protein product [Clavelina lepadiformis]|uniref:Nuclear pore complex protein n=1 Tax=Clavelina lepadiformis TaxID=159417 RepID=A0ABP0F740_CLALP